MYINPGMVEACFRLDIGATLKIVALALTEGKTRQDVLDITRLSVKTVATSLKSLTGLGIVAKVGHGTYRLTIPPVAKAWVNIPLFIECLHSDLPAKVKLVALAISKHVSKGGNICYPSVGTLVVLTGMAKRTVQRHVNFLLSNGMIQRLKQGIRYFFKVLGFGKNDTPKEVNMAGEEVNMTPEGCKNDTHKKEKEEKSMKKGASPDKEHIDGNGKDTQKEGEMRVADIVSKMEEPKENPIPKVKCNANGLVILWKHLVAKKYLIGPIKQVAITGKQKGMLGHFIRVGDEIGASDPREVLQAVVDDWAGYMAAVSRLGGLGYTPQVPTIEWVVKYANLFYHEFECRKVEQASQPTAVKLEMILPPEEGIVATPAGLDDVESAFGVVIE